MAGMLVGLLAITELETKMMLPYMRLVQQVASVLLAEMQNGLDFAA